MIEEESISSDLESRFAVKKLQFFKRASSDLQLPLRQWGASNFYLLVLSKGKQLKPPRQWGFQHCRNGVVDHLAGPSENSGMPVLFAGHNLPPLVEMGLTDLPKFRRAMAPPASPG